MLIHKLRLAAMSVLLLAAVATGAGCLARSLAMNGASPWRDRAVTGGRAVGEPRQARSARARCDARSRADRGPDDRRPAACSTPTASRSAGAAGRHRRLAPHARSPVADDQRRCLTPCWARAVRRRRPLPPRGRPHGVVPRSSQVYAMAGPPGPATAFGWAELNPDAEQPAAEVSSSPSSPSAAGWST